MKKVLFVSTGVCLVVWLLVRSRSGNPFAPSWSTKIKLRGHFDQVKGSVEQIAGRVVGNKTLIVRGTATKALGAVEHSLGKAVQSV